MDFESWKEACVQYQDNPEAIEWMSICVSHADEADEEETVLSMNDFMRDFHSTLQNQYDGDIDSVGIEQVLEWVRTLVHMWTPEEIDNEELIARVTYHFDFNKPLSQVKMEELTAVYRCFGETLQFVLHVLHLSTEENDFQEEKNAMLNVRWVMYSGFEAIKWSISTGAMYDGNRLPHTDKFRQNLLMYNHVPLNEKLVGKATPYEVFTKYLLQKASEEFLARHRDFPDLLYRQKKYNGKGTYAWEKAYTLEEFIGEKCSRIYYPEGYEIGVKRPRLRDEAMRWIRGLPDDYHLPILDRDRHVFSFRNGVYFCKQDHFAYYADGPVVYPAGDEKAGREPVAANFIDEDLDPQFDKVGARCAEIETPYLDIVFNYQNFSQQTQHHIWALLGRLLYWIGEEITFPINNPHTGQVEEITISDCWNVCLCLHGIRGTGKSTVANVIYDMYSEDDKCAFANDMRKIQGLEGANDKFLILCPDLTKDFWLNRGTWQVMVEGGPVSAGGMYMANKTVKWRTHMLMVENENPFKNDLHGSAARRQATIIFPRGVNAQDVDPQLERKVLENKGNQLLKMNRMYHCALLVNGKRGFWDWCSEQFKESSATLKSETNPWLMFLQSEEVVLNPEEPNKYYISLNDLRTKFKDFCRRNLDETAARNVKTTPESYAAVFSDLGLYVRAVTEEDAGGRLLYPSEECRPLHSFNTQRRKLQIRQLVVFGCDVKDMEGETQE